MIRSGMLLAAFLTLGVLPARAERAAGFDSDGIAGTSGAVASHHPGMQIADAAETAAPIRIAVFPFEYSDFSADGPYHLTRDADLAYVQSVTDAVRQALAQSGRYVLVDTDPALAARGFYGCDGCDVAIAARLGAGQSLVGVVRRISRTEYTIGFRLRDVHSGTVLEDAASGLRMGADYSWKMGAVQLIRDRLLSGAR